MTEVAAAIRDRRTFQRKVVRFQVLSPLHIGTREGRLLPMEYIFNGNRVYAVDDEKLGRFLVKSGGVQLIDQFVQAARSGDLRKGIAKFLQEKAKIVQARMREVAESVSTYDVDGGSPEMSDFRPFVRDGFGRVYIPGTSLKGVFRTAVLYGMLDAGGTQKADLEIEVQERVKQLAAAGKKKEFQKKFLSEGILQKNLLQNFKVTTAKQPQNRDLLRCLKVRDAYPVRETCKTRVLRIEFLSKTKGGAFYWSKQKKFDPAKHGFVDLEKPLSMWVEAVTAGVFETEIWWDEELFEVFRKENATVSSWPVSGLDDVLKKVSDMSRSVTEHELAFFKGSGEDAHKSLQKWYGGLQGDLLRIGFGSGMLGTTVNLLWSDALRQNIRNVCGHPRHDDPAPKSRRVWKCGESDWRPMGWIRVVGEDESIENLVRKTAEEQTKPASVSKGSDQPKFHPQTKRVRTQPVEFDRPGAKSLMSQAKSVPLEKFELQRLVDALDDLDPAEAHAVASILKVRLTEAGRWKKHPLQGEIEIFIKE